MGSEVTTSMRNDGATKLDAAALSELLQRVALDPAATTLRLHYAGLTPSLAVLVADFLERGTSRVTSLDLTGNAIGSHGANCLAASLHGNAVLQRVTLAGCALKGDVVRPWAECAATSALQHLDLSNNHIEDDAADALCALVGARDGVTSFDLRKNRLSASTIKSVAAAMQANPTLLTLRVNDNQGDEDDIYEERREEKAANALVAAQNQIAFYSLRNRRAGQRREMQLQIESVRLSSSEVECCHFDYVALSLDDAQFLAHALHDNRSVRALRLRDNALPPEGMRRILLALQSRGNNVQELQLIDNDMGDVGMRALSELMRVHAWLRSVDVHNSVQIAPSVLTRPTISAIHHTLARDTVRVRVLKLTNCGLTDEDAGVLASGIAWACQLESLELRNNAIGDRSVHSLARMLRRCSRMHKMDLSGNRFSLVGLEPLAVAACAHSALRVLCLGRFASYDEHAVAALTEALQDSESLVRVELMTKERASRCEQRIAVLHAHLHRDMERRTAFDRETRARDLLQHEGQHAQRSRHCALVRRVAYDCVVTWLRGVGASRQQEAFKCAS